MGFKLKVVLHLAAIALSIVVLTWLALNTRLYITVFALALVLVLQVSLLLRYISTTNQQLTRFLQAVQHADFSQSFRDHLPDKGFQELGAAFDIVLDRFRRERTEKEELASYLQVFIKQVPVPILCLEDEGAITISNNALRRLIGASGAVTHLRQVHNFSAELATLLETVAPGADTTLRLPDAPNPLHLKVNCSILRARGRSQKLLSIQDIHSDMDEGEVRAWQNLIRVMTHEIMNSIAPISSLADTTGNTLGDARRSIPEEMAETRALLADAEAGIEVIQNRSAGLIRFVQSYRTLAKLPQPELRTLRLTVLLESVGTLMAGHVLAEGADIRYACEPANLTISADKALLEQALINMLNNALEAASPRSAALVEVSAKLHPNGKIAISVRDNGVGINPHNYENVFVPFFTTKRQGSGIGMSLIRQIAILHGGNVTLDSILGEGTTVTLWLPNASRRN